MYINKYFFNQTDDFKQINYCIFINKYINISIYIHNYIYLYKYISIFMQSKKPRVQKTRCNPVNL